MLSEGPAPTHLPSQVFDPRPQRPPATGDSGPAAGPGKLPVSGRVREATQQVSFWGGGGSPGIPVATTGHDVT